MLFNNRAYELPWWMKVFTIIFLFACLLIPIVVVLALLNYKPEIAIYGLQTSSPLSPLGLAILLIFAIKGMVAYGIYKELKWPFKLGKIDAIVGIVICVFQFGLKDYVTNNSNIEFEFRLELFILIPYLIYLIKNDKKWTETTEN